MVAKAGKRKIGKRTRQLYRGKRGGKYYNTKGGKVYVK